MNAYELADELWEKYLDNNECQHGYALSNGCPNDDCKEQALYDSATMLRQQAENIAEQGGRIAELEKEFDAMVMSFETRLATRGYEIQIKDQADRIAELENKARFIQNFAEEQHKRACDLENKPVKQLSDEDIEEFAYAFELWLLNNPDKTFEGIKDFARAIIKEITE